MARILFGCECSGYPSETFAALGHLVTSCDLKEGKNIVHRQHIQADLFKVLMSQAWDGAIIFPPCTFICRASGGLINQVGRRQEAIKAIEFIKKIFRSPVPNICVENPIGFLNNNWCKASQIIYPWQFGDPYSKDICLWLRGFPQLHTKDSLPWTDKLKPVSNHVNSRMSQDHKSEIKSSWKHFPHLVHAMATQWTAYLEKGTQRTGELFTTKATTL